MNKFWIQEAQIVIGSFLWKIAYRINADKILRKALDVPVGKFYIDKT